MTTTARIDAVDFVVLFSGNVGRYQALDKVMAAARLLADERGIRFLFMGEGAAKADRERQAGDLVGPARTLELRLTTPKGCIDKNNL